MITNFEEYTPPITEEEKRDIVPALVQVLQSLRDPMKQPDICKRLQRDYGITVNSGAKFRKLVHYIRVKQLVCNLVASSAGYYVSYDQKEIRDYMRSLDERIEAIKAVRQSFLPQNLFP